jgi:type IV pilus assembly protein PilO
MEALYDKIGKMELAAKLAILLGALAVIGISYFFGFYKDIRDQRGNLESAIALEKKNQAQAKKKLEAFRKLKQEVKKLRRLSKRLARSLPDESMIPLGAIHKKAEASGVQVVDVERQDEERTAYYGRIPIKLVIRGAYHRIMEFFWKLGQMDRIVKISDITVQKPVKIEGEIHVTASCKASTFRYLAKRRRRKSRGK